MTPASDELIKQTETLLSQHVRAYLDFWWSWEGRWGEAIESAQGEQEARQLLCTSFYYLLQRRLSRVRGWSRQAWFDGFYPERIDVAGRDALAIPGTFLWVEGQHHWWLESGLASVKPDDQHIPTYTIKFGDADRGLRTRPHGQRRAQIWVEPTNWMFTFDGTLYSSLH